jgi:Skp family chaperone for outer membrane proteins
MTKMIQTLGLLLFTLSVATGGELRIATVDLQRLTDHYVRAQEFTKDLKEREARLARELQGLRLKGLQLLKETESLKSASEEAALNADERDAKKRTWELRLADLREFEVRYEDTRAQQIAELQNRAATGRKRVLEEIASATRRIADVRGYNLVLNYSRASIGTSEVIHSKDVSDLTDAVLGDLNPTKAAIPNPLTPQK